MGADPRLARTEDTGALSLQAVARFKDIPDLVADVMDAARRVLFQKARDRGRVAERAEQLDLGVRKLDEDDRDAVVQQMSAVINELIEQSGAGGNPAYATAKLLFCSLPRSLFGSAATVYDLWCAS